MEKDKEIDINKQVLQHFFFEPKELRGAFEDLVRAAGRRCHLFFSSKSLPLWYLFLFY